MLSNNIKGLDEPQRLAVFSDAAHALVVAPPGSGKTRVLAARTARLIAEGVDPERILAVTFTNRAAGEMRERVKEITGKDPRGLNIGTFHGICHKFLKEVRPGFVLYGREEVMAALKGLGVKPAARAAERISYIKNHFYNSDGTAPVSSDKEMFEMYQGHLKEKNALDLDDLILETIRVLEEGDAGARFLGSGLSHILIDEYQDINPPQARFVKTLTRTGANLFAIGDPDQAVYSFRGSSLESFMRFEREFPGSTVIRLERNYRSAENIVRASDSVISNNRERFKKGSRATKKGGEVFLVNCSDERSLTEYIIKEIENRMGGFYSLTAGEPGGRGADLRFSDFAVLFRTNRQGEAMLDVFKMSAIPCRLTGPAGVSFMDLLRRLRESAPDTEISLVDFIMEEARVINAAPEVVEPFLSVAKRVAGEKAESCLDAFHTEMSLLEPSDTLDIKADKVNLMTLHTAKGLEFRCVFIAGVEDGLIPLCREDTDMEEERRLFYVGMTRAIKSLYLLSARKRRVWGKVTAASPSPFIRELPEGLLKKVDIKKKAYKRRPVQKGFFD